MALAGRACSKAAAQAVGALRGRGAAAPHQAPARHLCPPPRTLGSLAAATHPGPAAAPAAHLGPVAAPAAPVREPTRGAAADSGNPRGRCILSFGKHRDSTYDEVLALDPEYCDWVLKQAGKEDSSSSLMAFADYLRGCHRSVGGPPTDTELISGRWLVKFGKYRGQTMEEVASQDGVYCEWVLGQVLHSTVDYPVYVTRNMLAFAAYLQQMQLREQHGTSAFEGRRSEA